MDVESGSVFEASGLACELALRLQETDEALISQFSAGLEAPPAAEIREALAELRQAQREGLLGAEFPAEDFAAVARHQPALKALCLHAAHDCDLRCGYCFAGTGTFHGNRALMPPKVARAALEMLIRQSGNRTQLEVDFFGGEPTLNFPMVQDAVAFGKELAEKNGKKIRFTLTTNGYSLTREMMDFCNREMYNVVISLDGRPGVHNAMRPHRQGMPTFDTIVNNARQLLAGRDKSHYIRGTFTARNLDFCEDVACLSDLGFTEISLEPVVLPDKQPLALRAEHLPTLKAEYEKLAQLYLSRRGTNKAFNFFHFQIDPSGGPCLPKRVTGCGAGCEYAAVTPEGDIYPCHQFAGDTATRLGNVLENTLNNEARAAYAACNVLTKPACSGCFAKYYCSGGCTANAYHFNKDIYQPYAIGCELEKKRVECALAIMAVTQQEGEQTP